jgi:hypothetical protein
MGYFHHSDLTMTKSDVLSKRLTLLTNVAGHTHLLDDSEDGGMTSCALSPGEDEEHCHPWVKSDMGVITVGESDGHTHEVLGTMKRDFTADERKKLADKGAAMPDGSFPISNKEDLHNALHAQGRSKHSSETVRAHIRRRAKALGLEGELPESFGDVGKNQGESMDPIQELKSQISDLEKKLDDERAYGALNDAEKQLYDTLDKADRKEFLRTKDRKGALEKADKANPVIYTGADGTVFRKSDDPRMVAMAKRNDALEKSNREQSQALADANFAKRASEELGSLPGKPEAKVALLKAVEGIADEATRKAVSEMVKASSSNLAKAFRTVGTAGGASPLAGTHEDQLETMAKRHVETAKVTIEQARAQVMNTPEGKAIYQQLIESKQG